MPYDNPPSPRRASRPRPYADAHQPGVTQRASEREDYEEWRRSGRTLLPARDTGLAAERRLAREKRQRHRRSRQRAVIAAVMIVALALAIAGWRSASGRRAEPYDPAAPRTDSAPVQRSSEPAEGVVEIRAGLRLPDPTPIIASRGKLDVRLPVRLEDLTELGFHQASHDYALSLRTPLPFADMKAAKRDKSTHRDLSKQKTGPTAALTGKALVMWRSRPGKPDTAVDVGAKPGSDVLAPVTGTVVKVKRYKLYGKHTDFEIHIRPTGYDRIDCVMIHIEDVSVVPGDVVRAGVSRIGAIRKLSDRERLQLGSYTRDGGDHTHVQLNDVAHPSYKGLDGALSLEGS